MTARLRLLVLLGTMVAMLAAQLGAMTPAASAATQCRDYDGFNFNARMQAGTLCAAPSSDWPRYRGWVRLIGPGGFDQNLHGICTFGLFPYDIDDPMPMMACPEIMPAPIPAWRWTSHGWQRLGPDEDGLFPGARAYVYPYGYGWRWIWTQQTGWVAVQEGYVALRWFTPAS